MAITDSTTQKKNAQSSDQKQLDREVREMLSSLTHRLTDLHHHTNKSSSSSSHVDEEHDEERGVRIITLAGTNMGATMKADLDGKLSEANDMKLDDEGLTAYANSNYQAINNSIMLGGSYTCKDPGVHMETSSDNSEQKASKKNENKGKKAKGDDSSSSSDSD